MTKFNNNQNFKPISGLFDSKCIENKHDRNGSDAVMRSTAIYGNDYIKIFFLIPALIKENDTSIIHAMF